MNAKQRLRDLVDQLPDDATMDDVLEGLYLLAKIEQAEREIDAGKGVAQDEVERRMAAWLRSQKQARATQRG